MTALVDTVEQVTPDDVKHFDHDARQLLAEYHLAGWRSHLTSKGHVFLKAPDGQETASISRESLRGRSGRNAAAPLKRWRRRVEQEREQARKGAGSSFGITDLDKAREDFSPKLPPRVKRSIQDHPDVLAYIRDNAERFDSPDAVSESMYIGIDMDEERPWEKWTLVDLATNLLVAHGAGITRAEALTMLRAEGKLPPATTEEIMAQAEGNTCPECGYVAERRGGLELHVKSQHTGYICPECGDRTGFSPRGYSVHRQREHGILPKNQRLHGGPPRFVQCEQCDQRFENNNGLANHVRAMHNVNKRHQIVELFEKAGRSMVAEEVSEALGVSLSAIKTMLPRMTKQGTLTRLRPGVYALPPTPSGDVTVTSPVSEGAGDVPVTSPDVPDPVVGEAPMDEGTAAGVIDQIRGLVSPVLLREVAYLRTERDRLVHENELLTKELDDMRALMTMLNEVASKRGGA